SVHSRIMNLGTSSKPAGPHSGLFTVSGFMGTRTCQYCTSLMITACLLSYAITLTGHACYHVDRARAQPYHGSASPCLRIVQMAATGECRPTKNHKALVARSRLSMLIR